MNNASGRPFLLQTCDQAIGLLWTDAGDGQQPALLVHHQEVFIGIEKFVPASVHSPMVMNWRRSPRCRNRCRSALSLVFGGAGSGRAFRLHYRAGGATFGAERS